MENVYGDRVPVLKKQPAGADELMTSDALLEELNARCFAARFRRLREIGTGAKSNPEIAQILNRWEQGLWQERYFCVQACSGSGDADRLLRMTDDSSRTVSGLATKLLTYLGTDEMLIERLEKSNDHQRLRLLSQLKTLRRYGAIDRFLESAAGANVPRIAELIPYGSVKLVERLLPLGKQLGGRTFWRRLARQHPRLACQAMKEAIAQAEEPDGLLLAQAGAVITAASNGMPDAVLELVRLIGRFLPLNQLNLNSLQCRRPREVAQIVLETEVTHAASLQEIAGKLDADTLLRVLRQRPMALRMDAYWLRKISGAERQILFQGTGRSWRDDEGLIALDLLALLPSLVREEEAKRVALLPILSTRPQLQANYAAYLPWDAMREVVNGFLSHPEGAMRALGWQALLTSLRYHRERAAEVLAMVRKRQNEQDPVRLILFQHLASLPPAVWNASHLVELAGVIRDALDATDLSYASVHFLIGLLQKLIPRFPRWAAGQLVLIYRERGNLGGYQLESRINDDQAQTLQDAFLDVGEMWGKGNRVEWLVNFASSLGNRLSACTRLMQLLAALLGKKNGKETEDHDETIVSLLRRHLPYQEFEPLVKKLIESDASWVAIPEIFQFLHRYRQDWLAPHLSRTKFTRRGGMTTTELITLLPESGYQRYTEAQQTTLAQTLSKLKRLPKGDELPWDVSVYLRAIDFFAKLPAYDGAQLFELAKDRRPLLCKAALGALSRLDRNQGLPELLAALDDSRASLAIYVLRKAVAERPSADLIEKLKSAPLTKVTVAKEIVRLVGEFGGAAALDWLLSLSRLELHRDVRIALLRALWDHLEHSAAWVPLEAAVNESDGRLLGGVVRIPADRLSQPARRKLVQLLSGLLRHGDAAIRQAALKRFIEMPIPDGGGELIEAALARVTAPTPDERELAARVLARNAIASDVPAIAGVVRSCREQHRVLHDFLRIVTAEANASAAVRRRFAEVARALVRALEDDPLSAGWRLTLCGSVLGADAFESELQSLAAQSFPLAAILNQAETAITQLGQTKDLVKLPAIELRFAAASDPHLRLLGFITLTVQARDADRWTDERRERLARHRTDPSPLVAMRAQYFFEDDPERL